MLFHSQNGANDGESKFRAFLIETMMTSEGEYIVRLSHKGILLVGPSFLGRKRQQRFAFSLKTYVVPSLSPKSKLGEVRQSLEQAIEENLRLEEKLQVKETPKDTSNHFQYPLRY